MATSAFLLLVLLVLLLLLLLDQQAIRGFLPQHQHQSRHRHFVDPSTSPFCPSSSGGGRSLRTLPRQRLHLDEEAGNAAPDAVTDDDATAATTTTVAANKSNKLDRTLSALTSAFPLFVLAAALVGTKAPSALNWVNAGPTVTAMLASVMCGTGLTLEKSDFADILSKRDWTIVPIGVLCQFSIMPLAAGLVGRALLLSGTPAAAAADRVKALFLGLCLVGSAPGGTASNLVSLIAGADVALSVLLTTCSTLLAVVATPLLVKFLVGSAVSVSGVALCEATARVVFLPVLLGMLLKARLPKLAQFVSRFTPFGSVLLVALICGGVVAQNASLVQSTSMGGGLLVRMCASVLLLHTLGFFFGYVVPLGLGQSEKRSRTVSIEVGMQNSALAVVLARSIGAHPLASLPGALSATAHSCLGSILAAYWRLRDANEAKRTS